MLRLILISSVLLSISCANRSITEEPMPSQRVREELSKEVRLSDDNKELNSLRSSLPEQKRKDNDELAEYLTKLQLAERDPDKARTEFTQLIQSRREKFRDKMNKLRESYSTEERKRREDFNASQNKKREEIRRRNLKSKDSLQAYTQISEEQKDFYAREKLRRKDFESEMQIQLKDFDFMVRERQQAFNEQLRSMKKKEMSTPAVPLSTED